ncbi:MAG: hypothetical protein AAGH79_01985 [Bacteroidota bacterium]
MACSNYTLVISGVQSLFLAILLGLCPNPLIGQSSELIWMDGNQDGHYEKIETHRDAGNYFYSDRIIITDTLTGIQDSFQIEGTLGQFTVRLPLRDEQLRPDRLYILSDLAEHLTGKPLHHGYHPATRALTQLKEQDACLNFCDYPKAGCRAWTPGNWTEERMRLQLISARTRPGPLDQEPFLLLYYGHNHTSNGFTIQRIATAPGDTLLVSRHGLIRQQADQYTWLFHSDEELGAPTKLRWASFGNIYLVENLLFVEQNGIEQYLLVFNWQSGRWLRYVLDLYERYEITDTSLHLIPFDKEDGDRLSFSYLSSILE